MVADATKCPASLHGGVLRSRYAVLNILNSVCHLLGWTLSEAASQTIFKQVNKIFRSLVCHRQQTPSIDYALAC